MAETVVGGEFEQVGNSAFAALFRHISGDDRSRSRPAMTAPFSQAPRADRTAGEKIAMMAPVAPQAAGDRWAVNVWARYDPLFAPWSMRRNEILVEVEGEEG